MSGKTKGIFLKNVVDLVRHEKGDKGVKELGNVFGDINFSSFKDYSDESEAKLNDAACIVLYGQNTEEGQYKLGLLSFQVYASSVIGKTMFSLFGGDVKKMSMAVGKILDTVSPGMGITVEDLGGNKVRIVMKNSPYNIHHYEGIYTAAVEHFNFQPEITTRVLNQNDHEYTISWTKNNIIL